MTASFAESRAWSLGSLHACRGQLDQAFSWLDRAYRQREGRLAYIKADPCISPLEGDPRYRALLKKIGIPE